MIGEFRRYSRTATAGVVRERCGWFAFTPGCRLGTRTQDRLRKIEGGEARTESDAAEMERPVKGHSSSGG